MKKLMAIFITLILLGTAGGSLAQDAQGQNPAMSPKARLNRQHRRIRNGVKSGKISKVQHRKLAREGRRINRERKSDLKRNGGKLTKNNRRKLERQENKRSRKIYHEKHS